MNVIEFGLVSFSLLMMMAQTALLAWANYKANFVYRDGRTTIDWNSKGEGKLEFFLLVIVFVIALTSLLLFVFT